MQRLRLLIGTALLALVGCSDSPTDPDGENITLTDSQAALLVGNVQSFGSSDPTLAALADTVDVVLRSGAEARRISINTNLGATSYYAVSLHRAGGSGTTRWSTFHVIAFDHPSAPVHFVILGGYASGTTAPDAVSGPIGGMATTSLTAHLFQRHGDQFLMWHASAGNVSLESQELLELCDGGSMACVRGVMNATFSITSTVPGNGATGQRTASGSITDIPGIRLKF